MHVSDDHHGLGVYILRPPCKKTNTGFFTVVWCGYLVQTLSFKQSSEAVLLFRAAKFFQTRSPDG
jgi:hypothetical protein